LAQNNPAPANAKNEPMVPGYQVHTIEGFKVLVNQATLDADVSQFERKPLDVLALELGMIAKMFPEKTLKLLRNLLIWVEWDEQTALANGRVGNALAVYYGGHQRQMLREGKHPLKARTVMVLSMKGLTREHQPKTDSGRCVLLHEIAHAVHDQILGTDNAAIKAGYRLAMERNLYDKSLYVATNEAEFFAETTCMYFNQCGYFPKTRAELKKHDPATFKMQENIWGKRADDAEVTPSADLPAITLKSLALLTHMAGPTVDKAALHGKHVAVLIWHAKSGSSRIAWSKVNALDDELREFGLTFIGLSYVSPNTSAGLEVLKEQGIEQISCYQKPYFNNEPLVKAFTDFPQMLVFNPQGNPLYLGSAFAAEEVLRKAVGTQIIENLNRMSIPAPLQPIVDAFKAGKPPVSLLPKLIPFATATDADVADIAKALIGTITARAKEQVAEAEKLSATEPVTAFLSAEIIAERYKGTIAGNKAADLVRKLKTDKAVLVELRARPSLLAIRKLDVELSGKPGSFDPTLEKFRCDHSALLAKLNEAVNQLRKQYAATKAAQEAGRIADKYAVLAAKAP
jgi:hypothetical protein